MADNFSYSWLPMQQIPRTEPRWGRVFRDRLVEQRAREVEDLMHRYFNVTDDDFYGWAYGLTNGASAQKWGTVSYLYHICDASGTSLAHSANEGDAIRDAESRARANPGQAYYVTKAITKSFVAPTPTVTTRL